MDILVIGGSERHLFFKLGFKTVGFLQLLLFNAYNFAGVLNAIKQQKVAVCFIML